MGGKDELRYKLKIKRRYFEGVRREYADLAILDNFIAALAEGGQESFFVYNSFGTEASTQLIIERLLRLGKAVYRSRTFFWRRHARRRGVRHTRAARTSL